MLAWGHPQSSAMAKRILGGWTVSFSHPEINRAIAPRQARRIRKRAFFMVKDFIGFL
jgi:hypothetical protein